MYPEYYRKYRLENPDKGRAATKRHRQSNPERYLLTLARARAKSLGLEFDLEEHDIVIPDVCPVLFKPLVSCTPYAPSVDRIDPNRGYTKDNIQIISKKANTMKSNASPEDLKLFAEWITKNDWFQAPG